MEAGLAGFPADPQAKRVALLQKRHHDVLGRSRIGGAFQHDKLPLVDVRRDRLHGSGHVAQIRLVVLVQRRGHANDDGIHAGDLRVIGGGAEPGLLGLLNLGRKNAHDVGSAGIQGADFIGGDVEAGDAEALVAEQQRQGQADIAHAHNADACLPGFDALLQFCQGGGNGGGHAHDCTG